MVFQNLPCTPSSRADRLKLVGVAQDRNVCQELLVALRGSAGGPFVAARRDPLRPAERVDAVDPMLAPRGVP